MRLVFKVLCLSVPACLVPVMVGGGPSGTTGALLIEARCDRPETAQWLSQFDVRLAAPGRLLVQIEPRDESALMGRAVDYEIVDRVRHDLRYYCCSLSASVPDGFVPVWISEEDEVQVLRGPVLEDMSSFGSHAAVPLAHNAYALRWFPHQAPEAAARRARGAASLKAAAEISYENIERIVNDLSYDAEAGTLRTRYSFRDETVEIALPYVSDLMAENLGERGSVQLQEFPLRSGEGAPVGYNVIGSLNGAVDGTGYYVLSGHYDSIGIRTEYPDGRRWDGARDPAPGADDNASGVAVVLECARVLSDLTLDFGLKFICFSGEEQGIVGSSYFVDNMEIVSAEGPILGTINVDMVAYNPLGDTLEIVTDTQSAWISDFLVDSYDDLAPQVGDLAVLSSEKLSFPFSDDGAFQAGGVPAVTCVEKQEIKDLNPYYHTVEDNNVDGKLNISQATKTARLIAGALAALAASEEQPDYEVLGTDIVFSVPPVAVAYRGSVGDTALVLVRVRNTGGPAQSESLVLRLYDGDPDRGAPMLGQETFEAPFPAMGGHVFEIEWPLTEGDKGSHRVTAEVALESGGADADPSNNRGTASFAVVADGMELLELYVYPSPAGVGSDAALHLFLTQPAGLTVDFFDASGRRVGGMDRARLPGRIPGFNFAEVTVPIDDMIEDFRELPSGVYFYRVAAYDGQEQREGRGRFVIVR